MCRSVPQRIVVVIVFLFFSLASFSQHSFTGRLLDEWSGLPLAGATVSIPDFRLTLATDTTGAFIVSPNPGGRHLVEFSSAGYHAVVLQVDFSNKVSDTFYLHRTIVENEPVVVTGVVRASDSRRVPFTVSVVGRDALMRNPGNNLMEQLQQLPGVNSMQTGPALAKPMIRGMSYHRVLVVQDGVRQEGQQWGDEHGLELDEWGVQRIEVLKGPASLVYGSDAMGGVINMVTDIQIPDEALSGTVYSDYHSNNRTRTLSFQSAVSSKGNFLKLLGSLRDAGDYHNAKDGSVFNSRYERRSFGAVAGIKRNWGYTHLKVNFNQLKPGMVEGERDSVGRFLMPVAGGDEAVAPDGKGSSDAEVPYQMVRHTRAVLEHSAKVLGKRYLVNVAYQHNHRKEFGEAGSKEPELHFNLHTLSWMGRLHLNDNAKLRLSVGTNGMHQWNRNAAEERIVPNYDLTEAGAFVYAQRFLGKFTLTGGTRFDWRTIAVDPSFGDVMHREGFRETFGNLSAAVGGVYAFSPYMRLKLNLSRAYRSPSISELASNGAHEGTGRYEIGNRDLNNETSWQGDLAFEWHRQHIALSLTGFVNHFNNFIFYRKLTATGGGDSLIDADHELLQAFTFSQSKAVLYGGELEADWHPHPFHWLHLHSALSMVYGKFNLPVDGSRNMPMMPPLRWQKEARADFSFKKGTRKFFAAIQSDWVFDQNKPFKGYDTETSTPGYFLMHASAGIDLLKGTRQVLSVSLHAKNIGNVSYQSHLSRLKYAGENPFTGTTGLYEQGRNFIIAVRVPFRMGL